MWDLTTALEQLQTLKAPPQDGGPSARELLRLLEPQELSATPCVTPSLFAPSSGRLKPENARLMAQTERGYDTDV